MSEAGGSSASNPGGAAGQRASPDTIVDAQRSIVDTFRVPEDWT